MSQQDTLINLKEEVVQHISENNSFWFIIAGIFVSYLGLVVFYWLRLISLKKYEDKQGRPFHFNKDFFIKDNWKDFTIVASLLPFIIVFYPDLFNIIMKVIANFFNSKIVTVFDGYNTLTVFVSFAIGFFSMFAHRRLMRIDWSKLISVFKSK